jgi:hypothetical protein
MSWVWVGWVIFIAVSFAAFEGYALKTGKNTLSRTVWIISKNWPPFGWVCGVIVGFLAAHFWWGGIVCFAPVQ